MSMQVLSPRSALLSNFEVLHLLREYESDQLARHKSALRLKKEEEERAASGSGLALDLVDSSVNLQEEVCENLRTVEFEAIQYLSADFLSTKRYQSAESVASLVKGLKWYDLTKAEKLQIVNLVPVEAVELYVIVEEIEERFSEEQMEEILSLVRSSLSTTTTTTTELTTIPLFLPSTNQDQEQLGTAPADSASNLDTDQADRQGWEEEEEDDAHGEQEQEQEREQEQVREDLELELEFDDLGAGAGVEGDLEMGDENDDL